MAASELSVAAYATDDMGSGQYRVALPVQAMQQRGINARWTMVWDEFVEWAEDADVLMLLRASVPGLPGLIQRWKQRSVVIYLLDDLIHELPPDNPSFQQFKQGSELLKTVTQSVRLVDGMIVSSWQLQQYYMRYNGNIIVIPNYLDFGVRDWDTPCPRPEGRVVVGWSGASQHQSEAETIMNVLSWCVHRFSHVDIALYCHPNFVRYLFRLPQAARFPVHRLFVLPGQHFSDYPYLLGGMHIGIAPLENTLFNRAKCLHGETKVCTPSGWRDVRDLKVGGWVWNGERYVHVLAFDREGWTIGLTVYLECGLSLSMTTDHRVLTSIGWLNAGRLRRGDQLRLSRPHLPGGDAAYSPEQAAEIFACLYAGKRCAVLDGVRYDRRGLRKRLSLESVRSLFVGWSDTDAVRFLHLLLDVAGQVDRKGVRHLRLERGECVQCIAEMALIADMRCVARWHQRSVRLEFPGGRSEHYSRVLFTQACWLEAVDIQVEGELFCANGVMSHNSSLKPLEYMARGVVPVASDVAEYRRLKLSGAPVLLARTIDDWKGHLERLVTDSTLRQELSEFGADWVRQHYDIRTGVSEYLRAIHIIAEWKRLGRSGAGISLRLERKSPCPCGSGKRYGRCCHPAYG